MARVFLLVALVAPCLSACAGDPDVGDVPDGGARDAPPDDATGPRDAEADAPETRTDRVSYYDDLIVFELAEPYVVGRFVNGDYWVHNHGEPVVIEAILPAGTPAGSARVMHGTMVTPRVSSREGYDSAPRDMTFDPTLDVDPGFTGAPLVVAPGSSVIKAISTVGDEGRPIISDAAILTVLAETPPEGSFRPPYVGDDRSVVATIDDLDYRVLGTHPRLGSEPDLADVSDDFDRVWLEHCTEWSARDIHPANHMPTYGRDLAGRSARGLLLLQLDYTDEEKEHLLIGLVQYGIDLYGIAREGAAWNANGGHSLGRKMPLLLAGTVLHHEGMLAYADAAQHFIFQDDQQHFYVSQAEVDLTHSAAWDPDDRAELIPYEVADIGMAEWGIRHTDRPTADNRAWGATYRHVNGPAQTMHILAAHLMGVEAAWNWPAVFDYVDRYYDMEQDEMSPYVVDLWEAYRGPR
jgi:hypothetical protein